MNSIQKFIHETLDMQDSMITTTTPKQIRELYERKDKVKKIVDALFCLKEMAEKVQDIAISEEWDKAWDKAGEV